MQCRAWFTPLRHEGNGTPRSTPFPSSGVLVRAPTASSRGQTNDPRIGQFLLAALCAANAISPRLSTRLPRGFLGEAVTLIGGRPGHQKNTCFRFFHTQPRQFFFLSWTIAFSGRYNRQAIYVAVHVADVRLRRLCVL